MAGCNLLTGEVEPTSFGGAGLTTEEGGSEEVGGGNARRAEEGRENATLLRLVGITGGEDGAGV